MTDIPTIDLEEFEIPEDEDIAVEDKSGGALKFAFIGGGQCGSRIVEAFYRLGYSKSIVINTTNLDMHGISVPTKMIMNIEGQVGGAGKNMKIAEAAIKQYREEIYNKMLTTFGQIDHIFVVGGLGGGTGGGSLLGLTDLARKYMSYLNYSDPQKRVGVIATLPTHGETNSPAVSQNALEIAKKISAEADCDKISPLVLVDNDKIKRLYKNLTVNKFYPTINNSVAQLLNVFNLIATKPSEFITFDSSDFQSLLNIGGHMVMGVTNVSDFVAPTSVAEALRKNLTKTLLASEFDLTTAKGVAALVIGGNNEFDTIEGLMDNIESGFDMIASLTGNAKVHRGIYVDDNTTGKLRVYTLISGLLAPKDRYRKLETKN